MGLLERSRLPRLGLIIATVWASMFALILVLEAFGDDPGAVEDGQAWEGVAVVVLVIAALAAVGLSWRRRDLMVPAMLAVGLLGVAIAVVTAGSNHWLAASVAGGPYLLASGLGWLGRPR